MCGVDDVVERLKLERRLRGWSIRQAAHEAGVSNQTWGMCERSGVIGDAMQLGVMRAFSWPANWQIYVPPAPHPVADETSALRAELRGLRDQLTEVLEVMADLVGELRARDAGATNPKKQARTHRSAAGQ